MKNTKLKKFLSKKTLMFQAETMNGHCVKFDKEVLRKPERDNIGLSLPAHYPMDTMSVNSEIA